MAQGRVEFTISFWVDWPDDDDESDATADRISDEVLAAVEAIKGVQPGTVQAENWHEDDGE